MKVLTVVAARPQFIKAAAVARVNSSLREALLKSCCKPAASWQQHFAAFLRRARDSSSCAPPGNCRQYRNAQEVNRILTDRVSKLLFCLASTAVENLQAEGLTEGVHLDDVMYNVALHFGALARLRDGLSRRNAARHRGPSATISYYLLSGLFNGLGGHGTGCRRSVSRVVPALLKNFFWATPQGDVVHPCTSTVLSEAWR